MKELYYKLLAGVLNLFLDEEDKISWSEVELDLDGQLAALSIILILICAAAMAAITLTLIGTIFYAIVAS